MKYFVYILRTNSGSLYTGQTNNLAKRLTEHAGKSTKAAKYLRAFSSFTLVHTEELATRSEALKREWQLKQLSHAQKEAIIRDKTATQ